MEISFSSDALAVKEHIADILGKINAEGKGLTAACFNEENKTPLIIARKTENGKITYYTPDESLSGGSR